MKNKNKEIAKQQSDFDILNVNPNLRACLTMTMSVVQICHGRSRDEMNAPCEVDNKSSV